jgi:hypothetical protein
LYLEDQKPQPKASPSPPAGVSSGPSAAAFLPLYFEMKTSMNLPKYTAEEISEVIDRITTLRMRWLRQVEAQLASQGRRVLDDYKLSGEPAE